MQDQRTDSQTKQEPLWPFIPRWLMDADLTAPEFRLLCYLWSWAGKKGNLWRPATKIEKELKLGRSNRKKCTAALQARGLVVVKAGHNGRANHYHLNRTKESIAASATDYATRKAEAQKAKGATNTPPYDANKGATNTPPFNQSRGLDSARKGPLMHPPTEPSLGTVQCGNTPKPPEGADGSDSPRSSAGTESDSPASQPELLTALVAMPDAEPCVSAEDIWQAYPRKAAKPVGLKSIEKAMKKIEPQRLLKLVQAYAVARQGKTHTPHPSTWFNQERYNDGPEEWKRSGSDKPEPTAANRTFNVYATRSS